MYLKALRPALALAALMALGWWLLPWSDLASAAMTAQRGFQEAMARALRAVQAGQPAAVWSLCGATAAYGFFHALGPGHGKILLGGAAIASGASLRRMTALTLAASLAQAASAIALVGTLALAVGASTQRLGALAETWLAPASYAAMAALGGVLVWRGLRLWRHGQPGSCGHAHGPTPAQAATLTGLRDSAALVGSIALRPCTGALFLLALSLRFDVFWIGCLATVSMGLGTAAFNLSVASSGVAARWLSVLGLGTGTEVRRTSAALHLLAGGGIAVASLTLLWRLV